MGRHRKTPALAVFALLAVMLVGLSGCDFLDEFFRPGPGGSGGLTPRSFTQQGQRIKAVLTYLDFEKFVSGTATPHGGGLATIMDKVVRGDFSQNLPFTLNIKRPALGRVK